MTPQGHDAHLQRIMREWLEQDSVTAPAPPVDAAIAFAYDHPRRSWARGWRRDAMADGSTWLRPALLIAALVGLLALTVGGTVLLGSRPQRTPVPAPSVQPGAGFMHPILEGDPIDERLLGEWRNDSTELGAIDVAFFAASSPTCVETFHTDQDCMVLTDPRNTFDLDRGQYGGGIVAVRDGILVYRETLGSPIRTGSPLNRPCWNLRVDEEIEFRIDGDRLYLAPAGSCWPSEQKGWWLRP